MVPPHEAQLLVLVLLRAEYLLWLEIGDYILAGGRNRLLVIAALVYKNI